MEFVATLCIFILLYFNSYHVHSNNNFQTSHKESHRQDRYQSETLEKFNNIYPRYLSDGLIHNQSVYWYTQLKTAHFLRESGLLGKGSSVFLGDKHQAEIKCIPRWAIYTNTEINKDITQLEIPEERSVYNKYYS